MFCCYLLLWKIVTPFYESCYQPLHQYYFINPIDVPECGQGYIEEQSERDRIRNNNESFFRYWNSKMDDYYTHIEFSWIKRKIPTELLCDGDFVGTNFNVLANNLSFNNK